MSVRTKNKTVKPEEAKSIFGRIKGIFKSSETLEKATSQRRDYNQTTEEQIKKMFRLHKAHPKLCYGDIAKSCGVKEPVVHYWLEQKEQEVLANFKVKKGRKLHEAQKKERIHNEKKTKSKKQPKTISEAPETDKEEETEMSLSTFIKLSEKEGQKILEGIEQTNKHPIQEKASPKFKGAVPSQAVASEEEWKEEDRKYKIGKATMHKAIVAGEEAKTEEARKTRLRKKHLEKKPKNHLDDLCPSCNPKSEMTTKQYDKVQYRLFQEQRDFAINKGKELARKERQLSQREKTVVELEKESLGNVAERAKTGSKLCKVCDKAINYPQESRCKGIWGVGEWYCGDHEPKELK